MIKLIFVLFVSFGASAGEGKIEILSEAFVSGPSIQLGEIAKFVNLSKSQVAKIRNLTLADAPSFGEVRTFSSQALAEMLRSKLHDNTLKFEIPANVVIKNKSSKIDSSSIRDRIIEGVTQTCNACKVEVRDLIVPSFETLPVSATWDLTPDWNRVRGGFQIPLEITLIAGKKSILWVSGKAQLSRDVVVVRRNLLYGERIEEQDLEIQKRDITYKPDVVLDPKEAIGAQAKMPVSANTLLTRAQIQKQPALVRGQNVTVKAGEAGWNISMKGVAEENGIIGDSVRIQNPITKKIFVAKIVAAGVVEVK